MTPEERKVYYKAWSEANKEKLAARKKLYREANKEKLAARKKLYREANKEKEAARTKLYREANKEKEAARKKLYREANKEKARAYNKLYREANKEKEAARHKAKKINLEECYVSNCLHLKKSEAPKDLIELKRQQIEWHRFIRQLNKHLSGGKKDGQ